MKKKKFIMMAKMFGHKDPREFALVFDGWSQEQRQMALKGFCQSKIDISSSHLFFFVLIILHRRIASGRYIHMNHKTFLRAKSSP